METVKTQAFKTFDYLSEREQALVFELILSLAPDDIATSEDLIAHAEAIKEYERGETVTDKDINWD